MPGDILDLALVEDLGGGDVTVRYFTDPHRTGQAKIVAREACCLAGGGVAAEIFCRVDPALEVRDLMPDGAGLAAGDVVLEVSGAVGSILTAERTALNFVQRLSGVATMARAYVDAVAGTGTVILDTRKTTPGMRLLEKAAVAAGGATNHRIGLYDMVMVKDNHLAAGASSGLQDAVFAAKRDGLRVELEADTLEQVFEFYRMEGVDVVLLDNMSLEQMREAVRLRPANLRLEASGGVTLSTVRAIAETGVDFISVGALTHSARAIDFSLEMPLP